MKIPIYQVDAFTSEVFSGNPAAVCILESWIDDKYLQSIAAENNLSETAFLVQNDYGFDLRWFTPVTEVPLCGHATLASAFVLFANRQWPADTIRFETRKSGQLVVTRRDDLLDMDFPARAACDQASPAGLNEALGVTPEIVFGFKPKGDRIVVMAVLSSENAVRGVQPDFGALSRVECRGAIITAKGDRSDFVSRYFAPRVGIAEDPVTGSAHCLLVPYWASVLGKNVLHAFQVSKRGGELFCRNAGERVRISGRAALYMEGMITI
ncbi:MAG: PhzF family phenazine biosynthesis protein [Desulfobacteraceae bacterium]|nr:MAG: PhzF family phenazine biosynthesis protein [Desulfobacteraceae bacterium]